MARKLKSDTRPLLTRQEIAVAMGVTAGTITRWENDGMPVAQKVARGRPTRFDLEAVRPNIKQMAGMIAEAASSAPPPRRRDEPPVQPGPTPPPAQPGRRVVRSTYLGR